MGIIILCTGISGCGKLGYIERLKEVFHRNNKGLDLYNVGDLIFQIAKERGKPFSNGKILDIGPSLDYLRCAAFERILRLINRDNVSIIVTHACFRWDKYLYQGFDISYLQTLNPDMYITVIDDIALIKKRQDESPQWKNRLTEMEISIWRDEETFITKLLAQYHKKPFYIIPFKDDPINLYNLIFYKKMKKIYLSYSISNIIKTKPEKLKEVKNLQEILKQGFVVFDPLCIEDLIKQSIQFDEITLKMIQDQTISRDYGFIDQADFVVVYYPVIERSLGVAAEMRYCQDSGKKTYAVIDERSPFKKEFFDESFSNVEGLLKRLSEVYNVKFNYLERVQD